MVRPHLLYSMKLPDLSSFALAYLTAALFTDLPEGEIGSGEFSPKQTDLNRFPSATLTRAQQDCDAFIKQNSLEMFGGDTEMEKIARDFWYTRNHHGCGFWDGDYAEEIGKKLTASAKTFGETSLYRGRGGWFYFE